MTLTLTDLFAGAGGSSTGATSVDGIDHHTVQCSSCGPVSSRTVPEAAREELLWHAARHRVFPTLGRQRTRPSRQVAPRGSR